MAKFLNDIHEERFFQTLEYGDISINDIERVSFFYIVSGNEDLYSKVHSFYNFDKGMLKIQRNEEGEICLNNLYLSSGTESLLNLAIQLYNNQNNQSVMSTFGNLDKDNMRLALEAIKIRFNIK